MKMMTSKALQVAYLVVDILFLAGIALALWQINK